MSTLIPTRQEFVDQVDRQWLDLSLAQRAVWLDASLSTAPSAYTLVRSARITGYLDSNLALQALNLTIARHDALRLRVDAETPRQWLHDSAEAPFSVVDLTGELDPDLALQAHLIGVLAKGMPLGEHPLFFFELIKLRRNDYYIFMRCHHLLADDAAVSMILHHWLSAYAALTSDTAPELAPPSSYLPVIAADTAYAASDRYRKDLDYWLGRFRSLPPTLVQNPPCDSPSSTTEPIITTWTLKGEQYRQFAAATTFARLTPQRLVFGLLAIVLSRRYSQTDVALGMALHGRDATNLHVLGMLAGMIAVRCRLDVTASLLETIQQISNQIDQDLRHQRLPIDALSRELGISRTGLASLFQVAASYIPAERSTAVTALDNSAIVMGSISSSEASPLTFHSRELPGGIGIGFDLAAHPDFMNREETERLMLLFQGMLNQFLTDSTVEVALLPILTTAERVQVVGAWNATTVRYPVVIADCAFEQQALKTPHAQAVISADQSLTYQELDSKANHLANLLIQRGVPPQSVVGVALERSVSTVVSLLATLKAGCVYLPLDPSYPAERLAYMLADSKANLVIVDSTISALLPSGIDRLILNGEEVPKDTADSHPARRHQPSDTAYIIYTSGSTGKPKGVAVPHSAVVNLAFARLAHDPISSGDRILAAISVGFDVSIGQLLLPLLSGATVVIAGDLRTLSAEEFWNFLQAQRVTHINSVPSFFESILDSAPRSSFLARLMLGGEPLSAALVKRLQKLLPTTQVVNMYGPTEACIDATFYPVSDSAAGAVLPIGKPLANYRAYILNHHLDTVGIGVPGELYLAGAGLAHAYINQPALTASRFVADPFTNTPGQRLYKTGDLARWRGDGNIEFLGRTDSQVKIRGHRIELGEIEAALLLHPAIAQTAVIAKMDHAGTACLIAYIVIRATELTPEIQQLRSYLATDLPDYMLPAAFCTLAALPLTANGKLDLSALPPVSVSSASVERYVAPSSDTEKRIAAIFSELLRTPTVGLHDNFFELGGHSLLATRLVSQIRSSFNISVPLRSVFESPSVQSLALYLNDASIEADNSLAGIARPEHLPLAFTQERLWFLSELQKDDTYNVAMAMRLRGEVDVTRIVSALEALVARHEALRTCIVTLDGQPIQKVQEPKRFHVEMIDLSHLTDEEQAHVSTERLSSLAHGHIDLATDLPIRLELITLSRNHQLLSAVIHHAFFDGWSAGLFFREFAASYSDRTLEPAVLQYAEFALWQRQQEFTTDLAYWRTRLAGAPQVLEFPTDRTPSEVKRRVAAAEPVKLNRHVHTALQAVANKHGASLFMLLHAAFATLLSRWSSQQEIVIGTVVANRARPEFESIIGCFVNTLALRTNINPKLTFAELLMEVRTHDLAAYEHQGVPFERVVDTLQPERSLYQTPLFQAMLVLQNDPMPKLEIGGLQLEPIPIELGVAKFNLTLNLAPDSTDGSLGGSMEYASDLYDSATILRFAGEFLRLLEVVAVDPNQRVMQVDLLAPAERQHIISGWNATDVAYTAGTGDGLFQQQVRETPNAIAVMSGSQQLTYLELDLQSNQLAHLLVASGIAAQSVVGVALERSVATIVSLLAILKAGCTYLPLDPSYPADRLAYMLSDSGARLVITNSAASGLLPPSLFQIAFDSQDAYTARPTSRLETIHSPSHTAYIIYTSGSTGKPKGVAVPHSAAVNLAFARLGHDPIGTGDRVLAAISVGFDVSIGQLLLPLLTGATVVIASDLRTLSAQQFWSFLETNRVTHINSVPSFFDSTLEACPESSSLVRLMLGGEPLSSSLIRRLQRALPTTQVVNMYGPTEACIDATYYVATGAEAVPVLPIGKPLPNYRVYILNEYLDPVSVGVTGDLYLAGAGLAHGYVNQPGLTSERFIANPFASNPGQRLYNTGDRARWKPDGSIDFLGRADTQVKLRGHRIELGEIEVALALQHGVREAVVIVREDIPGNQRLVAYYLADQELPAASLRDGLASRLPPYMVPAAFVRIDAIPLTMNGKLDRMGLPVPGVDSYGLRVFEPPQGEREEQIASVFAETLKVQAIDRHDNFFELGGHSLLAMTVIDRLRQQSLHVDVRDLFKTPTVAGLALAAANSVDQAYAPINGILPGVSAITPEMLPLVQLSQPEIDSIIESTPSGGLNIQDIYPLAPLQEGILFHHLMSTKGDAYLTPFLLAFDRRGRLELFLDALGELIVRHDILRTAVLWENVREPVQVVLREAPLVVEEVTLSSVEMDSADELRQRYDPQHFRIDVRSAPMLRAFVARDVPNHRWLLLLMSHHLILDHTSLDVILHEVRLISSGQQHLLPEAEPFRTFVAKARLGMTPAEHETFFRRLLGDVDEPTSPYGLLQVGGDGSGIRESSVILDPLLAARIRSCARTLGVGPATLFHLAWALVVAHTSDRQDVVFGTLLFGRMQSGDSSNRALGMFINTLPIRFKIGAASVESAVASTHALLAELLRHEHASLSLVQRCSGVPAPAPLFSALFNFRHSPAKEHADGGSVWPGVDLLFAQERTDYPIALAVDDRAIDFLLTAQADVPVDPKDLCRYMETALHNLVHSLEHEAARSIRSITVLPTEETDRLLSFWNQTQATYNSDTLHALFERQAKQTPEAIAVTYRTGVITYKELNAQADKLADSLAASGARLQTVIGVAIQRSSDTVIAFLAILKLGGIYLPLDPSYPADRLAFMIADSVAQLVLTNTNTQLAVGPGVKVFDITSLHSAAERPPSFVTPNDTAYIIYTSGSTGKPKGVAVPHSSAVNLAFGRLAHDPISTGDRVLAAISVGFDVSVGQLLLPLLSGATVVVADDLRSLSAREFWEFLQTAQVTHINSVPSFFESILEAAPKTATLVRLMLGGEPLTSALVRRLHQVLPKTQVINMYGPTEACIDATFYPASGLETSAVLSIGKPLPNYQVYILNGILDPVGVAVAGDLYLAGAGLAHAYINHPALTAERFIANPFGSCGQRLYRTGDRARWLSDGNIEFLGRADSQVKIRGHRIELGEIEAALLLHPPVRQAAVIVDSQGASSARLVAYLVFQDDTEVAGPLLRDHLAACVPEYMIPSSFCTLTALPLTANGKLDFKALPKVFSERSSEVAFELPGSATEIAMQQIWQDILDVKSIGIHDNFFSLGGHSLSVMRLINACNAKFQRNLGLRALFDHPTIAQLSVAIDTNKTSGDHPCLVPLRPTGTRRPLFCVHPAGGAVLRYTPLTAALNADQPVYGLQARALAAGQPLAASMEEMAADYIVAMRSVQPVGPYQVLGWSSGGMIAFEIAQQLTRAGRKVSFVGLWDTSLPDVTKKNPTESELTQAFAVTFGYNDLLQGQNQPFTGDFLLKRIVKAERLPEGSELDQFRRFYSVFCNSVRIYPEYQPLPWLGPFALFRALKRSNPMPDWSSIVPNGGRCIDIDCLHSDFPTEQLAPSLARHIEQLIEEENHGTEY